MQTTNNQQKTICVKLKEFFTEKGMSQMQIADALGVSQPLVGALLNGKPFGKKTAAAWSRAFGLRANWLLTGEGEMLESGQTVTYPDNDTLRQVASPDTKEDYRIVDTTYRGTFDNDSEINKLRLEYERVTAMVERLSSINDKLVSTNQKLIEKLFEKMKTR